MKDLPYFRWYPADAETDESYASMTDAELGFYHRCLNRSWINDGLPTEPKDLARRMGVTLPYLKKIWATVGSRFDVSPATGRYVNPRQERERLLVIGKSEKAAFAARLSHADGVRSQKDPHSVRSAFAESVAQPRAVARPDSGSVSEVLFKENLPHPSTNPETFPAATDEHWQKFCELYGQAKVDSLPQDFSAAWHSWRLLDIGQKIAALAAVERRVAVGEQILHKPARWLTEHEFERPLKPPKREQMPKGPGPPGESFAVQNARRLAERKKQRAAEEAAEHAAITQQSG